MQNRYVADFGDFVKLSILRELIGEPPRMRLGVAWWAKVIDQHGELIELNENRSLLEWLVCECKSVVRRNLLADPDVCLRLACS
jgi:hypothetical protein